MYNEILSHVQNLSEDICNFLGIDLPKIYILVSFGDDFEGYMAPKRNASKMYLELIVPHGVNFAKDKAEITAIIIHEHCHYYDAIKMTSRERQESIAVYINNHKKRVADEEDTWACTKEVAKHLGLWTKAVYKVVKACKGSSKITF